ncbi:hypothetical protein FB451DRAFT_1433288 [Mycena latifolia]|nr:hypothetical protein FB451DRAFT_1433288 [Mycena latifolia]
MTCCWGDRLIVLVPGTRYAARPRTRSDSPGGLLATGRHGGSHRGGSEPLYIGVAANCLGLVAVAANCSSEVAVNCFGVAPLAKTYAADLVLCITACPDEVSSAQALVQQFCAAAMKPTSLPFPSFTPSSTSAYGASSAAFASNSSAGSSTATAPASSSAPPPPTLSNTAGAPRLLWMGMGGAAMSVAGVLGVALLR